MDDIDQLFEDADYGLGSGALNTLEMTADGLKGGYADEKSDIIVFGNDGKIVRARTKNQKKLVEEYYKNDLIFALGPAGTGKTTMARLLAKEYLCEDRDVSGGACGKCYTCQAMNEFIETGSSDSLTNIREVDVTDSNKKQDIDDLLDDASLPAFDGNWKIYILDECHMMTSSAQNRLLKT